jgi:hypothetical protein
MKIVCAGYLVQSEEMRKCIRGSVGNTEARKPLWKHKARREGNIKMDFKWQERNWSGFVEYYEEDCSFENCTGYCVSLKVQEVSDQENF